MHAHTHVHTNTRTLESCCFTRPPRHHFSNSPPTLTHTNRRKLFTFPLPLLLGTPHHVFCEETGLKFLPFCFLFTTALKDLWINLSVFYEIDAVILNVLVLQRNDEVRERMYLWVDYFVLHYGGWCESE